MREGERNRERARERVILVGTTHATDNYNGALDAFIMCKTLHSQRHADGYDNKISEDCKKNRL